MYYISDSSQHAKDSGNIYFLKVLTEELFRHKISTSTKEQLYLRLYNKRSLLVKIITEEGRETLSKIEQKKLVIPYVEESSYKYNEKSL